MGVSAWLRGMAQIENIDPVGSLSVLPGARVYVFGQEAFPWGTSQTRYQEKGR